MTDLIRSCHNLRHAYHAVKAALPWLDACVCEDDPPAFPRFARPVRTPHIGRGKRAPAGMPPILLHTEVDFSAIRERAAAHPDEPLIIESGPRKILYFIEDVMRTFRENTNTYLCTYNFCNWMGIEQLCEAGFGDRLLYGSHMPRYSEDAAMGPIVMGDLPWELKCGIAGNNLRRLLGQAPVAAPETAFIAPEPFIIDAHTHNVIPGKPSPMPFPTPDLFFSPADWLCFMDHCALEMILTAPMDAIMDPGSCSREGCAELHAAAPERFRYFTVFHPKGDDAHVRRVRESLCDPGCVGIKLQPSFHKTAADDDAYVPAYKLAREFGKPIMTHSWEVSSYNPVQYLSHPDRFRKHLKTFPHVTLVLGHAGGRPSALDAVAALCREYPHVRMDLAADYYDNGLIDNLAATVGVDRILFGSDMNWMDPRCNLAPVLASSLSDDDLLRILRLNAQSTYLGRGKGAKTT